MQILTRDQHPISRQDMGPGVVKILYRLKRAGFRSCLVGGCIRDMLMNITPKDFDVATDAHPNQVRRLFRNCRLIGRRFRLAHVYYARDEFLEVSTFRRAIEFDQTRERDPFDANNTFGSIEEDAFRRDFTVNALLYDISDFSIIDYTGGIKDLEQRRLRSIGDPDIRFQEDPVRIVRAARFCGTHGFEPGAAELDAARTHAHMLATANNSRMLEELFKIIHTRAASKIIPWLATFEVLDHWLPEISSPEYAEKAIARLTVIDAMLQRNEVIPSSVILAALFYDYLMDCMHLDKGHGDPFTNLRTTFNALALRLGFARKQREKIRQIIFRQNRLVASVTAKKRHFSKRRFVLSPDFDPSFQLLQINNQAFGQLQGQCDYWQRIAKQHRNRSHK